MVSHAIQFLSKNWEPVAVATVTGFPNVSPPSVDRLTRMARPVVPVMARMFTIHTSCRGS